MIEELYNSEEVDTLIPISKGTNGIIINPFVINSTDYASDHLVRMFATIFFHSTVVKEYRTGMSLMRYILKNRKKFIDYRIAFAFPVMQISAAIMLETVFAIFINTISNPTDIVKDFIAIQIIATLDDIIGAMQLGGLAKYRTIVMEFPTEYQEDHEQHHHE